MIFLGGGGNTLTPPNFEHFFQGSFKANMKSDHIYVKN